MRRRESGERGSSSGRAAAPSCSAHPFLRGLRGRRFCQGSQPGSWGSGDTGSLSPLIRGCGAGRGAWTVCPEDHRGGPCLHELWGPLGSPLTPRPLCPSLQEPQPGGAGLPGRAQAGRGLGPRGHRQERDLQWGRGVEGARPPASRCLPGLVSGSPGRGPCGGPGGGRCSLGLLAGSFLPAGAGGGAGRPGHLLGLPAHGPQGGRACRMPQDSWPLVARSWLGGTGWGSGAGGSLHMAHTHSARLRPTPRARPAAAPVL